MTLSRSAPDEAPKSIDGRERDLPLPEPSDAFRQLFEDAWTPLVRSVALAAGVSSQTAQDAVQEAFVRLLSRPKLLAQLHNPRGWLYRTAHRIARRHWRLVKRESMWDPSNGLGRDDPATELLHDFAKALHTLPRRQRECIVLCVVQDWTSDQVADALNISAATVRVHLMRARTTLQHSSHLLSSDKALNRLDTEAPQDDS